MEGEKMDIRVYLSNGSVLDYCQTDSDIEQGIVAEINAGRLFQGKSVILGSGESCTMVQVDSISRIDLITRIPLAVSRSIAGNITLIENNEEFLQQTAQAAKFSHDGVAPGEEFQGCLHFELAGHHRLQFSVQMVLRDQLQFFSNLRRAFEIPTMWFEHPNGGLIALNVRNILSISSVPGFSQYPKGALLVKSS